MKSDIVIEGENAQIFMDLIEEEIYQSNVDIFFDALLIGLLESKKGEPTPGNPGAETVEITRTWINNSKRNNFKTLISNFINLESNHLLKCEFSLEKEEQINEYYCRTSLR